MINCVNKKSPTLSALSLFKGFPFTVIEEFIRVSVFVRSIGDG